MSAPISFASLRTSTGPGIRRDTATCIGSARHSRHGSHAGSTGTGYEWLADLARLEWACEESATAAFAEPVGVEALSRFDADSVPGLALVLQPSLRFVASAFPIWNVWQSNQDEGAAPPVDLDAGADHCVVACVGDRVAVYRLDPADHRLLQHLYDGLSLESASAAAAADAETLARMLGWAFGEGLVTQIVSPSAPA